MDRARRSLPFLLIVAIVHLLVAWPGAGSRGIIAEEVQPYLLHYPKVLGDGPSGADVRLLPPYDDPSLLEAVEAGRAATPRWVGTQQWPELGWHGRDRGVPVFVRGHQTALGSWFGVLLGPWLGDGIAGVRRTSVLLGLALVGLVFGLGRRFGLSRAWSTIAALGCVLSPGLWFFARTGYGFELASRVLMLAALFVAASRARLSPARLAAAASLFGAAVLSRATIAATLAPALLLVVFHPRRDPGPARVSGLLATSGGIPVAVVGLAMAALPFAEPPAVNLRLDQLAARTLVAPATAWMQLSWVVDPRVVLKPLIDGDLAVQVGALRGAIGLVVVAVALHRWWRARAGEAERLFVGALLGNAIVGAWLYGDPLQFQLGMALEPLFVLALVTQLASISRRSFAIAASLAVALLAARGLTLSSTRASERRTDNPMLSGSAQRALVEHLSARGVRGDDVITTAYDHVGVFEAWTNERLRPLHAYRLLHAASVPEVRVAERWGAILDAKPACHVVLTKSTNLFAGPFSDHEVVARALDRVLAARGLPVVSRVRFGGDGGRDVFELVALGGACGGGGAP